MKAARFSAFGGPEVLEIADVPDPHAGPGQVPIVVRAAGFNASDWKKRKGLMDEELPPTMGYEAAGLVDEVGEGVAVGDRVFGFSPDGDAALDVAGSGVLPELIEVAGDAADVVTIADFDGAQEHGARFSRGETGRAIHALSDIGALIESGRFSLPVVETFPLAEIAGAHRLSEDGRVHGKHVLVIG